MKCQPNRNYVSNDVVMTPEDLAERIVKHFRPTGRVLDPCMGDGAFYFQPEFTDFCEISKGHDFLEYRGQVDWIITNPPWSQIRPFLRHSMRVADEIVFLMTVNHIWTKARLRDLKEFGFGLREILLVDTPREFPASGFQLGAVYVSRGWRGDVRISG